MTTEEEPAWVELRGGVRDLLVANCAERLKDDGRKLYAPLWLAVLAQAWRGRCTCRLYWTSTIW